MASNIDPTKPTAGNALTADVRANFAAAKAEIESLQSGLFANNPLFNFASWLTSQQLTDARAGNLTFDAGPLLTTAITFLNGLAAGSPTNSTFTLVIPDGKFKIGATVTVLPHVNIRCEGVLVNSTGAGGYTMVFQAGSHCERLFIDCNTNGSGVTFGQAGTTSNMIIGDVDVINPSGGHTAVLFLGSGFKFAHIRTQGGGASSFGVQFSDQVNACSDVHGLSVRSILSQVALSIYKSSNIAIGLVFIDTPIQTGVDVQTSNNIRLPCVDVIGNDANGVACSAGYAINLGVSSSGTPLENILLNARVDNTGATGVVVGYIKDSRLVLNINKGTLPTGNSNNCTVGLQYRQQAASTLFVDLFYDPSFTAYTVLGPGTQAGFLRYCNGINLQTLGADTTSLGEIIKRKAADSSITSNVTPANDADLSLTFQSTGEWMLEFVLDIGAALATTGIKVATTASLGVGAIITKAVLQPDVITAANAISKRAAASGTVMDFTAAAQVGVGNAVMRVTCWVQTSGANVPLTVNLQLAQSTSSVTALTIRAGSYMRATKIQ